jgi:pimeloyl-ACP methyl ester carboxylesterase
VEEAFVRNGPVRLHVLHSRLLLTAQTPLLIARMAQAAEDYVDAIQALAPRGVIAMSFRGRGRSDAPAHGYRIEDHVSDIEAVIADLGPSRLGLFAFSAGVPYALGYALKHTERLSCLVIGDYPAERGRLPPEWPERFLTAPWSGQMRMSLKQLRAIQRETVPISYWDRLGELNLPVLVLHGDVERGALLSQTTVTRYRDALPNCGDVLLAGSGHDPREPNSDTFYQVLGRFLSEVDRGHCDRFE